MRAVNLLPRDESRRKRRKHSRLAVGAAAAAVVLVALLAGGFVLERGKVGSKRAELEGLQAERAAIPPPPPAPKTDPELEGVHRERLAAVSDLLSRRVAWDRVLREVSQILPEDVWLTALNGRSPVSPVTAAAGIVRQPSTVPTGFTLKGYTYSQEAVARLLSRLTVVPDLKNVQLQTSALTKLGGRSVVEFAIVADLRAPGEAA